MALAAGDVERARLVAVADGVANHKMACVIDHLLRDHRVTVLQDFRDARGTAHDAGEAAV